MTTSFSIENKSTYTSLELSEILNRLHKNVLQDIRRLLKQLDLNPLTFTCSRNIKNVEQPYFVLPKWIAVNYLIKTNYVFLKDYVVDQLDNINLVQMDTFEDRFYKKYIQPLFSQYTVHRQYPVGKYLLDFYISELNLAIEYDDPSHKYTKEQDQQREKEIKQLIGCQFVRYMD